MTCEAGDDLLEDDEDVFSKYFLPFLLGAVLVAVIGCASFFFCWWRDEAQRADELERAYNSARVELATCRMLTPRIHP